MNFNDHIEKIVESIVAEISSNVLSKVDVVITSAINARLSTFDFDSYVQQASTTAANAAFEKRLNDYAIDPKKLEAKIVDKINHTISVAESNTTALINDAIKSRVDSNNFQDLLTNSLTRIITDRVSTFVFPEQSINANVLKFSDNYKISGDNIAGGLIKEFSSTGIDDRSTQVALTILDDITVIENNLLTKDLTVEGSMIINGEFVVNGSVPTESEFYKNLVHNAATGVIQRIDSNLFENYSRTIFNQIRNEGLDLNKITLNNTEVITNNSLGSSITESNLQKVGQLKELQVSGESLLSESLYTSKGRIGINTIEPSAPLAVWDDEIEITVSKRQKDTGSIGTPRQQRLVLFANNKDNIILDADGSTTVSDLRIGPMRFTTSDRPPNYVSEKGHVVWNSNPNIGGPLGWICLGAANWANFGIID